MQMRVLGNTGLKVSRLGAGRLVDTGLELNSVNEKKAGSILNAALDGGINFFDTSACYGTNEEMIGRTIANRRQEYILATKCGHVAGGYRVKSGLVRQSGIASTGV